MIKPAFVSAVGVASVLCALDWHPLSLIIDIVQKLFTWC